MFFDRKAAERADFVVRPLGQPASKAYINLTVIPVLYREVSVPTSDVLGQNTSHA
jgi:hypothetical protein